MIDPRKIVCLYACSLNNERCEVLELTNGEFLLHHKKLMGWRDIKTTRMRIGFDTLKVIISCIDMVRGRGTMPMKFEVAYRKPVEEQKI